MRHAKDTTIANLLPEELLILANAHEGQEVRRYRLMALRFQPFNIGISRLMDMLVLESQWRLDELVRVNAYLGFEYLPTTRAVHKTPLGHHPFFVLDQQVASQALERMLGDERHSRHLYQQLLEVNATSELAALFASFIDQKQAQCRVLEEAQDRL
ncbi:hypothetical protein ACPF7Z_01620 [Halomonas sp. GXIMD04776]|uniref:hypothetical protein n=1 Tax=Halomonas sp. GXIMD04776 TaxID=3415605 RepID=UPI003C849F98